MKLYLSVDMEGLAGITNWKDETEERERFRKAMNQQVEWVLEGIAASRRNSEITKILIADSHGGGQNLSYDLSERDPRVWLASGSPRPQYMMPAMDESYDLAFFVGYHGGAGEQGSDMEPQRCRVADSDNPNPVPFSLLRWFLLSAVALVCKLLQILPEIPWCRQTQPKASCRRP